jgi:hypothetical protein
MADSLPTPKDWDFSALPQHRRGYLERDSSFETIARVLENEASCEEPAIEPCRDGTQPLGTWRINLLIKVQPQTSDMFYNGRDGVRGRYWQSPQAGDEATRSLLNLLTRKILEFAEAQPSALTSRRRPRITVTLDDVRASLAAPSAKVWAYEDKSVGFHQGPNLFVERWAKNENAPRNRNNGNWHWALVSGLVDVKGAFLTPNRREYIPEIKRDRNFQIHLFGFS